MSTVNFVTKNAPWLAAGATLTFLSSFGQTFFISIFAGEIREAFGLSHGEWGAIYSLGTAVSALIMVWTGGLTDRFRVRVLGPVVLIGLALACVSITITPAAWFLPVAVFLLSLFGHAASPHSCPRSMTKLEDSHKSSSCLERKKYPLDRAV